MTLFAIVALSLAGLAVYCAYKNPELGGALVVGPTILTVLWLITGEDSASLPSPRPEPGTTSAPWAEPPQTPPATPTVPPHAPTTKGS